MSCLYFQQRTSEAVRAAAADLSLPLTARKKIAAAQNAGVAGDQNSLSNLEQLSLNYSPKSSAILPISNVTTAPSAESTSTPGAAGSLSIMLKKGSKVQLKDLHVPITEEMAENIRQQNLVRNCILHITAIESSLLCIARLMLNCFPKWF